MQESKGNFGFTEGAPHLSGDSGKNRAKETQVSQNTLPTTALCPDLCGTVGPVSTTVSWAPRIQTSSTSEPDEGWLPRASRRKNREPPFRTLIQ